jgi:hypothetical protein
MELAMHVAESGLPEESARIRKSAQELGGNR